MVWSSGSIYRTHHAVELEMQEIIPMKLIDEIHDGEAVNGIQFSKEAVLQFITKKFVLSNKAKHGTVVILMTTDGAKLEGKLMHVTIGFKLVDVDSIDPHTGEKMYKNMKSDQWSFPLIMIVAKDKSRTYIKLFDHIFDFFSKERDQGMNASDGTQWNTFVTSEQHDTKSHQICLGRGGRSEGAWCHLILSPVHVQQ
jgi:hypothetical protein